MEGTEPLPREERPAPYAAFRDSWAGLSQYTAARIALGRAGASQRTETLLDFRLGHARARDAVMRDFRADALEAGLMRAGLGCVRLATRAADRRAYLMRPDLGRSLSPESRDALDRHRKEWGARDLAILVSDGLSAQAAERHAAPVLEVLAPLLLGAQWTLYPILVAPFGRVKLQDEVGERLGARHALMLLGERPGLGSPDSLGAYLTFGPRAGRSDADRNCVSNIRQEGLAPDAAGRKLAHLLLESHRLCLSGVGLKDTQAELPTGPGVRRYSME